MFAAALKALHPQNSIFGKIFLWFWLTMILCITVSSTVVNLGIVRHQVTDATLNDHTKYSSVVSELTLLTQQGNTVESAINAVLQHHKHLILAHATAYGVVHYRLMVGHDDNSFEVRPNNLIELIPRSEPVILQTTRVQFIGPYHIADADAQHAIFIGTRVNTSASLILMYVSIGLLLCIGTGLCIFLAWYLSRPIKNISAATHKLSTGDLHYEIPQASLPNDEVGRLARDFNTMTAHLRASIHGQQQLLANISHELRTPITRLRLNLALLGNETEQQQSQIYMQKAANEIEKMDCLIGEVLTLSRLHFYNTQDVALSDRKDIHVTELFDSVLDSLRFEAEQNGKTLRTTSHLIEQLSISAHISALHSAVENVVRNAIRYAQSLICCDIQKLDAHTIAIAIGDDGPGLQEQQLEHVIRPFVHSAESDFQQATISTKNAGLGLAIASEAIKLHNGSLHLATEGEYPELFQRTEFAHCTGLCLLIKLPIISG